MAATSTIVAVTATSVAASVGCTPNSIDPISRFSPSAPASPAATPMTVSSEPLLHDLREHPRPIRAERHANADFAAALRDHVGEHPVRADGGEQQRQSRKCAEQVREQPRPPDRFSEHRVHVAQPHDRHRAIRFANNALDRLRQRIAAAASCAARRSSSPARLRPATVPGRSDRRRNRTPFPSSDRRLPVSRPLRRRRR